MMEGSAGESLDGSSIKPVSSLRSHFEQMANSMAGGAGAGPLLSQSTGNEIRNGVKDGPVTVLSRHGIANTGDTLRSGRSKERQDLITGLQPPHRAGSNMSPSPTRTLRQRPPCTLPPEVTVQPPQSPPKSRSLNLTLSSAPAYLATSSPGSTSPRHFRIPSRPQTPLEPGKSPRLSASQPPSPPPPRRSGELRREASFKTIPPPVNRAEKPKISSKPLSLTLRSESTKLEPSPTHQPLNEKSSPFSTPPSSGSSPEHETPLPSLHRSRPWNDSEPVASVQTFYEPPPIHHSIANKRKDQDVHFVSRNIIVPQATGEQKPALPARPQTTQDTAAPRPMLPPPRPSADKPRPAVITTNSTPSFSTPPKRVFSTPTSQLQTPPRSHGRSMTVDRTSERTPVEFRTPVVTRAPNLQGRKSLDIAPPLMREVLQPNPGDYPDSSHSNRRPPYFKHGVREIPTKYETRIMDVCGEYVCTSGLITRIWSLNDGEIVASLAHTEGIKIMSVAFKPAPDVSSEGSRLWLGNNIGELVEIDVVSQSVVASNSNAHTRREIIKLYRHLKEMWTLDDGGTLHLWSTDNDGTISLSNPSQSFRVPKGHTFSMVVGDELWHATGKDLRVFVPSIDSSTQFQVLQRPQCQTAAGDITSGATINSQSEKVYFGHTDGKISIYSRRDYSCLGIVNISVYKVTSLAGVGGNLWASFSTGMVYVYDVSQSPWVIFKDWRAHQDPVIKLLVDPSSCWSLDRSQVITLGQDNMLRIWDGLLQDDWIETQMQSQETDFCELETIKALVMTWNAGASTPYHLQQSENDATFFRDLFRSSNCPDILVFGFQELVDLEDKKTVTKSFFKSKRKDASEPEHMSHQYRDWRDFLTRCLDDYMPRDELYHLLHTASLVGLFTCIFVRAPLRERIRSICSAEVKRGMGGALGNKGALIVRFILDDTSLCFINCHLAAGQTQTKDRNIDISTILESTVLPPEKDFSVRQNSYVGGGDGTMILDHEICILNGDLNYRIDTMGRDTVINAVKTNNLSKLLDRDQLLASRRKNPWFKLRAFHELPITFAPTYKYDVGTDNYDSSEKKRSPAWCDRLLYRGRDRIKQLDYRRHELRVSDHRPVTGSFQVVIKRISPKKRAVKWDECKQKQRERSQKLINEAKQYYLMSILGLDSKTSNKLIQEQKGG